MGAHNIEFEMPGTPNFSAVKKKFDDIRKENREYNGHQDGYSGDFQTVNEVKDYTHKTFDSYNEAHRFCLDTAQKWDFVVAVRYRLLKTKCEPSKKLAKLQLKHIAQTELLKILERQPVKLPKFATCEGCRSKVSTAHLHRETRCPVCREGDFRPLGLQRKLAKLKAKIELLGEEITALAKIEREKNLKKHGTVGTLVAGWGAS